MHFYVVKSKTLRMVVAMLLVMLMLSLSICGTTSAEVFFGGSTRKVPIYSVATEEKQVAISFDAAWGADKTEGILDILQEFGVGATFFLVGFWVDEHQELVKEIVDKGFEVGTHSNTHPDMVKLSKNTMKNELESSVEKIESVTGKDVKLFRAPFGSYNNNLLEMKIA